MLKKRQRMVDSSVCIICKLPASEVQMFTDFTVRTGDRPIYKKRLEVALKLEISETTLQGKCLCVGCEDTLKKIEELSELQRSFRIQFISSQEQMVQSQKDEREEVSSQNKAITESDNQDEETQLVTSPVRQSQSSNHPQLSVANTKSEQPVPSNNKLWITVQPTIGCTKTNGPVLDTSVKKTGCGICKRKFKTAFGLKTHMRMHQTVNPFLCKLCGESFRTLSILEGHIGKDHGDLKIFQCPVCFFRGMSAILVRSHYRKHHLRGQSTRTCIVNRLDSLPDWPESKQFITYLNRPESSHTCLKCSVSFATLCELEEHILTQQHADRANLTQSIALDSLEGGNRADKQDEIENTEEEEVEESNGASILLDCNNEEKRSASNLTGMTTKLDAEVGKLSEQLLPKRVKSTNVHACPECVRTFANDIDLLDHVQHHKTGKILMCALCNKGFWSQAAFENHTMQHSGKFAHKCSDCGKGFAKPLALKTHMLIHSKEAPYSCKYCKLSFVDTRKRRAHYNADHFPDLYKYECPHCNQLLSTIQNLDLHMRKKHKTETVQNWQCSLCEMNFEHLLEYGKHCRSEHEEEEKKFLCDTCHKTFHWKNNYIAHLETHLTTKTVECKFCLKKFKGKYQLQSHMHWHSLNQKSLTEQGYLCEQCGKSYKNMKGLKNHLRCHRTEHSFKCEICDYVAPNRSRFTRHVNMVHAKERPFKCSVCDKTFVYQISYTAHYNMHNDIRPHLCNVCGKGFRTRAHLKEHMNVHSQTMSFICNQCNKSFLWRAQLLRHQKIDHAIPNTPNQIPVKRSPCKKKPAKKPVAKAATDVAPQAATNIVPQTATNIVPQATTNKAASVAQDATVKQTEIEAANRSAVVDVQTIILHPMETVVDQTKVVADISNHELATGLMPLKGSIIQSPLFRNLRALLQQSGSADGCTWNIVPPFVTEVTPLVVQSGTEKPHTTELLTMTVPADALFQAVSPGAGLSTVPMTGAPSSDQVVVTTLPNLLSSSAVKQAQIPIPAFTISTPEVNITTRVEAVQAVPSVNTLQPVDGSLVSESVLATPRAEENIIEATLAATQLLEICRNAIGHSEQLL